MTTHTDADNGYSIDRPDGWTEGIDAPTEGSVAAWKAPEADDGFSAYIEVLIRTGLPFTLEQILPMAAASYAELPDFVEISTENTTLGGEPAAIMKYTYTDEASGTKVQATQLFTMKGKALFVIICRAADSAFGTYGATFDQVVNSLSFQ